MCSLCVKQAQPLLLCRSVLRALYVVLPPPRPLQAPCPDTYRGEHRDPENAGHLYALEVKRLINEAHSKGKKV